MATNDVCPMSGYGPMYVEKHLAMSESFINWKYDLYIKHI